MYRGTFLGTPFTEGTALLQIALRPTAPIQELQQVPQMRRHLRFRLPLARTVVMKTVMSSGTMSRGSPKRNARKRSWNLRHRSHIHGPPSLVHRSLSNLPRHNPALQPTASLLRGLSAAELGCYEGVVRITVSNLRNLFARIIRLPVHATRPKRRLEAP